MGDTGALYVTVHRTQHMESEEALVVENTTEGLVRVTIRNGKTVEFGTQASGPFAERLRASVSHPGGKVFTNSVSFGAREITAASNAHFAAVWGGGAIPGLIEKEGTRQGLPSRRARLEGRISNDRLLVHRPTWGRRYRDRDVLVELNGTPTFHSRMFRPAFFSVYRVGEVRPAWARVRAGLFIDPNVTPLEVSQLLLLVFTDAPVVTSRWNTVSL